MRRPRGLSSLSLFAALALVSPALTGCAANLTSHTPKLEGAINAAEIKDEDFAPSLHKVLKDGTPSIERLGLLTGVVREQIAHAGKRFASGHGEDGTRAVVGGFYLLHQGEGRQEMIDQRGERALGSAIDHFSTRGDEGRAGVLMRMRAAALPPNSPARAEIDEHIRALTDWMRDSRTGSPVLRLGLAERAAVNRALVEPSDEALEEAATAIDGWVVQAKAAVEELSRTDARPTREEALELQRSLRGGGTVMITMFLRYGNAKAAIDHVDRSNTKDTLHEKLYMSVRGAASGDSARDWTALVGYLTGAEMRREANDMELDDELLRSAIFGSSLEAYRRESTNPEVDRVLADSLVYYGMPEAAPLVMGEAVKKDPSPRNTALGMDVVARALAQSAEIDDLETARRTFAASGPILTAADAPDLRGRLDPSSAQARHLLANLEIRAGNLAAAKPLIEKAVAAEPSIGGYVELALLARQGGDLEGAIVLAQKAVAASDPRSTQANAEALLDVAEANVLLFELYRDAGHSDRAKPALDAGLAAVLAGRSGRQRPSLQARAERLLGRILDGYGDAKGATRALDRALQAASQDRPALGATMLDAVGRALIRRDLTAARAALKKGIDGDVSEEDLVYGGLWVSLLEQELKAPPDGTSERALHGGGKSSWAGKLAGWANGKISDSDLTTAAQSPSQKVEAAFYTAMKRKVSGDPAGLAGLKAVATSPNIELLEVTLAREIVAPPLRAELPANVKIP